MCSSKKEIFDLNNDDDNRYRLNLKEIIYAEAIILMIEPTQDRPTKVDGVFGAVLFLATRIVLGTRMLLCLCAHIDNGQSHTYIRVP